MGKTKAPKFSELLDEYKAALRSLERQEEALHAQQKEHDEAIVSFHKERDALVAAMKTYGISSIRENSWDTEYYYLDAECNLEKRSIATVEEADEMVTKGI